MQTYELEMMPCDKLIPRSRSPFERYSGRTNFGSLFILLLQLQLISVNTNAQFTKLLDLGSVDNGANPYGTPVSDGTFLYGTTYDGGVNGEGTVYKIRLDGTGFAKLLDFDGTNGSRPMGALFFDGVVLYGTTTQGGANGYGNVFKINPDGTGYATVLDFDYTVSGAGPSGGVISDGTFLYGMAVGGGTFGYGTIFKIKPDGSSFAKVLDFDYTNNGGYAYGSLYTDGTFLYGMTTLDGSNNYGTIFKVKNDGTGYTRLLNFSGAANGSVPKASLISDGTFLYGMTYYGGSHNYGDIFKIKPDGTGFAIILNFDYANNGAYPKGSLAYDGTFLYGTTSQGGSKNGTIFKIKTDGTGFVKLLADDSYTNGPDPEGTPLLVGTTLYGVKSGLTPNFSVPGYLGTIYKINTDGTGYGKLLNFEMTGNSPEGSLVLIGTSLYGFGNAGGANNYGTIFKVNNDGSGFAKILDFDGTNNGRGPTGRPIYDGTFLYGMTSGGGANSDGTIFKVKPDGTGYVKLLDFDYVNNGNGPNGSLISDGTFLYGMTSLGGSHSDGTIFKIKTDGTGYVKLLDFDGNSGSYPNGSLISDGTFLYGMASSGGASSGGYGTLFKIKLDGTGFAKLLDFDDTNTGSNPNASLSYDGTFLYGMTKNGGLNGEGTIFKIKTDGTGYFKLLDFDGDNAGSFPFGSVNSVGSFLYGMASNGGILGDGTLFRIKPDGTSFTKLIDFNDGSNPQGSLISDGTFLYGMTQSGGSYGLGTLFKSTLAPFVSITEFLPASGVEGTTVTIYGTDFDPTAANNIVKFNGVAATIISATATTLVVQVPVGATTGPITVTAGTTASSADDFDVTMEAFMFNGTVQNCNVPFVFTSSSDDLTETFVPVNSGDKVKVSFSSFNVGDILYVYDGPTITSPLLATLTGSSLPADIVATGSGGELTFLYSWQDSSSDWDAMITCQAPSPAITIFSQSKDETVCAGNTAEHAVVVVVFTVSGSGTTNIAYQWQFAFTRPGPYADISNIGGYTQTTDSTLSIDTNGNFGAGFYRCKVSGDFALTTFSDTLQLAFHTPAFCAPPTIAPVPLTTQIGGKITLDLVPLITTSDDNVDLLAITVVVAPPSGAIASIDSSGVLTIDYAGKTFSGTEQITIQACDTNGNCTAQVFNIDVVGDIIVYNGISPNGINPSFVIANINILPDTKNNTVYIFDRWENQVWHGTNYDNTSVVFTGVSDGGSDLPSGVYFYKIEFASGRKKQTGFISLRRK